MKRARWLLGAVEPDGRKWFVAAGSSRFGPMHSDDPAFSMHWESPDAIQEWLDSIPSVVEVKGKEVANARGWMSGLEFVAIEDPRPLGKLVALRGNAPDNSPKEAAVA